MNLYDEVKMRFSLYSVVCQFNNLNINAARNHPLKNFLLQSHSICFYEPHLPMNMAKQHMGKRIIETGD